MSTPSFDTRFVPQSYLDLANDVKPFLQIPYYDTSTDTMLQLFLDAACDWVQDYLGRPIAPTTFFRRFNGYSGFGGSTIDLPYYPVIGTPEVVEWWGQSGPHTLVLQTPENQGNSDMFTLDSLRGLIIRSYLGLLQRPMFPGLKNIEVTWTAGFEPIPPRARLGTLALIEHWWSEFQQGSVDFAVPEGMAPISKQKSWDVPEHVKAMFATLLQVGVA